MCRYRRGKERTIIFEFLGDWRERRGGREYREKTHTLTIPLMALPFIKS